jgi:hypothetical protein
MFVSWNLACAAAYAYLLGWYLGDGYVSRLARTYQLVVTADTAYPAIIAECRSAIVAAAPGRVTHLTPHPINNCARIECCRPRWPEAFPQHGPGRKHTRPIVLKAWQPSTVHAHPWLFLRGLIHSDGCRTVNRFSTKLPSGLVGKYEYVRYFFSSKSADIRALFSATCDPVAVRWTQSNPRNISISHRRSVALLDAHVGPKT